MKKKQKALCFQKKRYTLNNLGFCIKSALKKIIVTVFEKKKLKVLLFFFFSKIFLFKISDFCQKKSYDLKIHTQCTSGGTLKICRRNLKKNQFLLIFHDFGKKFDFSPNLGVFEGNLWVFKMVGNRQTQKKIFFSSKKNHGEHVLISLNTHQNAKSMRFLLLKFSSFWAQKLDDVTTYL